MKQRTPFQAIIDNMEHADLLPLPCLVCGGRLVSFDQWSRCEPCGYFYPHEVIASADPVEWHAILLGKLACTTCAQALPGMPRVHIGDDGEPIPCPGPAPVAPRAPYRGPGPWRKFTDRVRWQWARALDTWDFWKER